MLGPDTAQIMAALGMPTGPGVQLPAGAGTVFRQPAASWTTPQAPLVSRPQWGDTAAVLEGLRPKPLKVGEYPGDSGALTG
jgi:hypothetical protein